MTADLKPRKAAQAGRERHGEGGAATLALASTSKVAKVSTLAWGVSVLMHGVAVGVAGWLVAHAAGASEPRAEAPMVLEVLPPEAEVAVDLPPMVEVSTVVEHADARRDDAATAPSPAGGERALPRPDMDREGKGGMPEVSQAALNLADHDDGLLLSKDAQSRVDRSQVQRLKVGDDRTSLDDRRATWKPMELTFLASGKGKLLERRTLAEHDPSRGSHAASLPGVLGASPGATPLPDGEGESPRDPGSARLGGDRAAPAMGVLRGADGKDRRESAASAFARPQITEGRPAVPAIAVDKPKDNKDSDQEVASTVQSLLHASTAGGKQGQGTGGEKGPDKPGSGGQEGAGSKAKTVGPGGGGPVDVDGSDPAVSLYVRGVRSKVDPLWGNAFPRWAALEGRGGRAIIAVVIQPDGSVSGAGVARASGIDEFDANVRAAVMRAAPFGPLPASLKGRPLRVFITFDALNAAVKLEGRPPQPLGPGREPRPPALWVENLAPPALWVENLAPPAPLPIVMGRGEALRRFPLEMPPSPMTMGRGRGRGFRPRPRTTPKCRASRERWGLWGSC